MIQTNLFGEKVQTGIVLEKAAQDIGVSTATIRNWIKTGYLKEIRNGVICETSFLKFQKTVIGNEKLFSRANKAYKDTHNHANLKESIRAELLNKSTNLDVIGFKYEENLSNSYRNKEGIYYTPTGVVDSLLDNSEEEIPESYTFCDPCCGSGNFIIRAIEIGFLPENVFGFDVDPIAVEITKKRIFETTGYVSNNIKVLDFLEFVESQPTIKFDFIYTNPPWGKKMPLETKKRFASLFHAGKSVDTSALFTFGCLKILKDDGKLGMLMPESFFNIAAFQDIRAKLLIYQFERLIDYGKPFKGLLTRAQAFVVSKSKKDNKVVLCEYNQKKYNREIASFVKNPKAIINFLCDEDASDAIEKVFEKPHNLLKDFAEWGLGIVTGNNKKHCVNEAKKGYMPVFKGSDIKGDKLTSPSVFIPLDLSLYQQVAPQRLYESDEKLIYKFISSKLCFFLDTEKRYMLNSANMLILKKSFPVSGKQLCDLLNSDFMNWLFTQIFRTHKILRGDLEELPIHADFFQEHELFCEKTYLDFLNIIKTEDGSYRIKE